MSTKKRIGLCLGGGGTKGVAALPIIESLLRRGLRFSAISGTSVGAIIGAYLAAHGEVTTLKDRLLGMNNSDWLKLVDFTLRRSRSLIMGKQFASFYGELLGEPDLDFHDLAIPLTVAASNLQQGRVSYITKGRVVDALMASSAYPGIFPPYELAGGLYADGGIFDNLPYEVLLKKGIDKVIAINFNSLNTDPQNEFASMAAVLTRTFDLMMGNAFKHLPKENNKLFIFSPKFGGRLTSSFGVRDLSAKCDLGQKEHNAKEQELTAWLNS